jgi:ubiquinone/menaquinone biosynthesis C-methylase UbiE
MKKKPYKTAKVIDYSVGGEGHLNVATYDARRYEGPGNEYKQRVMSNAYNRLAGDLSGKKVLDVGCGTGRGVLKFAERAAFTVGADASHDMLSFARSKASPTLEVEFVQAYAQRLPFPDDQFDVVITLNFLHLFDLPTQREMIQELERVTKPGGILVLEFDNALRGVWMGLYRRWFKNEQGSLPWEIRSVLPSKVRVERVYGAVFPVIWQLTYRIPQIFVPLEKIAYLPIFNRLSHRVYYKLIKQR